MATPLPVTFVVRVHVLRYSWFSVVTDEVLSTVWYFWPLAQYRCWMVLVPSRPVSVRSQPLSL